MGITLGGIMRGALPVLQQAVEAPMQDAIARVDNLGKLYNAKAGDFQKKQAEALSDIDKVKTLANGLGVDIGIAEAAYAMSGKSVDKAGKIINNMLTAFKGNIPTSKIPVTETPVGAKVDNIKVSEKVEVAPPKATSDGIFKSFANLFKMYSPDDVKKMFAERSGIPLEQVDRVLNNTFDLPASGATRIPTAEALRAGMVKPSAPSQSQIDVGNIKQFYMDTMNYNEEEATKAANIHISGNIPLKAILDGGDTVQNIVSRQGELSTRLIPRFDDVGIEINPNKKDRDKNEKQMSSGTTALNNIVLIKDLLGDNSQVYSVLGRFQQTATNLADIFGQPALAEFLGGANVTKAIQAARTFIKTTKEAIFDDPRISDRDLQIINQYIGIIMDESALGVGKTNALAAIIALERAAVTQIASALAENAPGLVRNNKIISYMPDGQTFNANDTSTIAGQMYGRLMKVYKLDQNTVKKAVNAVKAGQGTLEHQRVLAMHENIMELSQNSVNDIIARKTMSAKEFQETYKNVYYTPVQTGA